MNEDMVRQAREMQERGDWLRNGLLSNAVQPLAAGIALAAPPLGSPIGQTTSRVLAGVNIWSFWTQSPHQTFARVEGGNLGAPNYFQRTIVHKLNAPPPGGNGLPGVQIDIFGGSWATPTDWHAYEPQSTTHSYYFAGQYHQDGGWHWDGGLIEEKTQYQNGWLFRLSYEDGHDARYNDHILQVALVFARPFENGFEVRGDAYLEALELS